MKRLWNLSSSNWRAVLTLVLLLLPGGRASAASVAETRAFDAAVKDFQLGGLSWERAEVEFAEFVKKYPASEHYADAVLLQAQARFKQKQYDGVVELLQTEQSKAGKLADQFTYWIAEALFRAAKYQPAVDAYARLIKEYAASNLRPEAILGEAEARSKQGDWSGVTNQLRQPDGPFQQLAKSNPTNEMVVRCYLLLNEGELMQKNYPGAEETLGLLAQRKLGPELEWRRQYLLCRTKLESGHPEDALEISTNLVTAGNVESRARGADFRAGIFEQLNRLPEAVATYETNLAGDLPGELQRQAMLKVVDLNLKQNKTELAAQKLEEYLIKHPNERASDLAILTLGELRLQEHFKQLNRDLKANEATNLLEQAQARFEALITTFTNSAFLGKAQLDLGWCLWTEGKLSESQAAFSNAVQRLPVSEDQAVARFKLADIQFQQMNFADAVTNYEFVATHYDAFVSVMEILREQALYQIVRSGMAQTNLMVANNAMARILELYPNGLLADRSMLLVGQGLNREERPARAREVFSEFVSKFPGSPLLPEVQLAIARTYENEGNWRAAIASYDKWTAIHTNGTALPRAEFCRAWANFKAGDEMNAFSLFTNFVARFQTNQLAPKAQYWVGEFFWNRAQFERAESSYQEVFQKWPSSTQAYQAAWMAGLAAMERSFYQDAISYFTNYLTSNSNCPIELTMRAQYAYGDALVGLASAKTNLSNFTEAISIFDGIATKYTNSAIAPMAWGRIGDCYRQLATADPTQYDRAIKSYQKVIDSPLADPSARGMAGWGIALSLEEMARLKPLNERSQLLKQALNHYLDVIDGKNLREDQKQDLAYVGKAGLDAGKLAEELGQWEQALNLYRRLANDLPPLQHILEMRIQRAQEHLVKQNN
jgi:TolA-binding protein